MIRCIFQYINLIKSNPRSRYAFYDQVVKQREMRWQNVKRRDMKIVAYVKKLTRTLHSADMSERFLQSIHDFVLKKDPKASSDLIKLIDAKTVQIQLLSPDVDTDILKFNIEPVTSQRISSQPIPLKTISKWNGKSRSNFTLPQINPFMPDDFSLCNIG